MKNALFLSISIPILMIPLKQLYNLETLSDTGLFYCFTCWRIIEKIVNEKKNE